MIDKKLDRLGKYVEEMDRKKPFELLIKYINQLNEDIKKSRFNLEKSVCIIGPEGGFDQEEIIQAKEHGCSTVTLGEHRLRTETAAIAAVSIISFSSN